MDKPSQEDPNDIIGRIEDSKYRQQANDPSLLVSQEELYKTLDTIVPRVGEVKGMTQELRSKVISTAITAINSLTLKQVWDLG